MDAPVTAARLRELADKLDCITEEDLALLGGVELDTVRTWRHRGHGPKFYKVGLRAIYPVTSVAEWVTSRAGSSRTEAKDLL